MKTVSEIRALLDAITPGQWKIRESPRGDGKFFVQAPRVNPEHPYDIEVLGEDDTQYPTKRADAEFVAAAPDIVRQLLTQLEIESGDAGDDKTWDPQGKR